MSTINSRDRRGVPVPAAPKGTLREHQQRSRPAPETPAVGVGARIAARAYEIYQARNGGPGDALADWLRAEQEIRETTRSGSAGG